VVSEHQIYHVFPGVMREAFYVFHFERYSRNVELAEFFKSIFRNKFNFPKSNIFFSHFFAFFVLYVWANKLSIKTVAWEGCVGTGEDACLRKKTLNLKLFFLMLKSEI
jgi:hypothetical protein